MANIGIVVRETVKEAVKLGQEVALWCRDRGHDVYVDSSISHIYPNEKHLSPQDMVKQCDPIVTLGGDGTLIGVGRYVQNGSPLLVGVNFGCLGFLTEIAPEEIFDTLEIVLKGEANFAERNMLQSKVFRDNRCIFRSQAINDVVILKGPLDKIMELDLYLEEEFITRYRCDGLIISTPTGSTAYNLAAGGPIIHRALNVLCVTPICSHSLTHRPIVLGSEGKLVATIPDYNGNVVVSIDGQEGIDIKRGDVIQIEQSAHKVRFVRSQNKTYFDILRDKFNWGKLGTK